MKGQGLQICAAAAVLMSGCSSRPRNFAPVLGAAPTDVQAYEARWLACRDEAMTASGRGSGRLASAAGGAVAGAGGVTAVSAVTASSYATMGGAMAALGAIVLAAPVAALGGAWGISKIKKAKKERAIKTATAACLASAGYTVEKWRVMSKREVRLLPAKAPAAIPLTNDLSRPR